MDLSQVYLTQANPNHQYNSIFLFGQEKSKIQSHDRPRRRHRLGSDDKKGDSVKDSLYDEVPRHCYGPGCTYSARQNSKYCSDECGIQLAVRYVIYINIKIFHIWKHILLSFGYLQCIGHVSLSGF